MKITPKILKDYIKCGGYTGDYTIDSAGTSFGIYLKAIATYVNNCQPDLYLDELNRFQIEEKEDYYQGLIDMAQKAIDDFAKSFIDTENKKINYTHENVVDVYRHCPQLSSIALIMPEVLHFKAMSMGYQLGYFAEDNYALIRARKRGETIDFSSKDIVESRQPLELETLLKDIDYSRQRSKEKGIGNIGELIPEASADYIEKSAIKDAKPIYNNLQEQTTFIKAKPVAPQPKIQSVSQQERQQLKPSNHSTQKTIVKEQHPLDRAKCLLETYDIQYITSNEKGDIGHLVVIDRSTGQHVKYNTPEEKARVTELAKELTFAKSWVKACGNDLSLSGAKNQLGIDERQWEYAFNEGAYQTYDMLIRALKNNTNPNINTQDIIGQVENSSNYKYTSSILQGLLNRENIKYDWQLNNIHSMLSKQAGLKTPTNAPISKEESPEM